MCPLQRGGVKNVILDDLSTKNPNKKLTPIEETKKDCVKTVGKTVGVVSLASETSKER